MNDTDKLFEDFNKKVEDDIERVAKKIVDFWSNNLENSLLIEVIIGPDEIGYGYTTDYQGIYPDKAAEKINPSTLTEIPESLKEQLMLIETYGK